MSLRRKVALSLGAFALRRFIAARQAVSQAHASRAYEEGRGMTRDLSSSDVSGAQPQGGSR